MSYGQDSKQQPEPKGYGLIARALEAAQEHRPRLSRRLTEKEAATHLLEKFSRKVKIRNAPIACPYIVRGEADVVITLPEGMTPADDYRTMIEFMGWFVIGCPAYPLHDDPEQQAEADARIKAAERTFAEAFLAGGTSLLGPVRVYCPDTGRLLAEIGGDRYGGHALSLVRRDGTEGVRVGLDEGGAPFVDLQDEKEWTVATLHAGGLGGALALSKPDAEADEAYPITACLSAADHDGAAQLTLRDGWGKVGTFHANAAGEIKQEVKA